MQVIVLGISHKRAPLVLRECLAFPPTDLEASLEAMSRCVPEGAILSTCHRVELYAAAPDARQAETELKRFWSEQRNVPAWDFEPHVYRLTGQEAVAHLFGVACGLDSAVIGEPQILGQVRDALDHGLETGSAGRVLSNLFRQAITTGRRARTQTGINRNAASIGSAAVELAGRTVGDLCSTRVALLGAGKMGELVARNLLDKGAPEIAVVGRTPERVRQLALQCGGAVSLSQLEDGLLNCDIVISCTSAPHHVIQRSMMERVMRERAGRPLFLVDIAVPRDIEPSVGGIDNVHLYNIDDLESAVEANVKERKAEARKAAPIISEDVEKFQRWLYTQSVVPTIIALRERADAVREAELARTSSLLSRLPERDRQRIEALTMAIQKKLLHGPIALLREQAASGDGHATATALRDLFDLDVEEG